jgi:hypothetical protein
MTRSPEMQQLITGMQETIFGKTEHGCCVSCKQPISEQNTHTEAGWRETKISGLCEDCFDAAFKDFDE